MEFIRFDASNAFEKAIKSINNTPKIVICGSSESKEFLEEGLEFSTQSPKEVIEAANAINILEWFKEKRAELEDDLGMDLSGNEGGLLREPDVKQGFTLAKDIISGQPHGPLVGAKVDVESLWGIPAQFKYGNWNDYPSSEIHCAIWKHWEDKYGAKIVGIGNDIIEGYDTHPPKTKEDAMALAWEQYLYCYDIVDQGVETISNLGSSVINHNAWYFWWD